MGDVLGRQARLDRVAVDRDVVLGEAQRLARGDAELLGDEVAAGDLLGDRVLDLDAAVALEEEVLAGRGVDHELDGPEVDVADRAGERDRVAA